MALAAPSYARADTFLPYTTLFRSMAGPIACPALVTSLDEHAAEAVLRRECDRLLRPLGRRAMLGAFGPAPVAADHPPPDADIFHRLEPADVAELVRLVEVEFEIAFDQPRRIVGDADRSPRGRERQVADDARSLDRKSKRLNSSH